MKAFEPKTNDGHGSTAGNPVLESQVFGAGPVSLEDVHILPLQRARIGLSPDRLGQVNNETGRTALPRGDPTSERAMPARPH